MAFWKIVGLEVTPTTASSLIRRSRSPSLSSGRDRKSIQTLWPCSESSCRRDVAIGGPPGVRSLPAGYPRHLLALPAVSSEQLLVLVLLAAAFAAGWFARGGRGEGAVADEAFFNDAAPAEISPLALHAALPV